MDVAIMTEIEQHYKLAEAARLLDVSVRTLRRWIQGGRVHAAFWDTARGKEYRIPVSELVKLGFKPVDEDKAD